MHSAAAQDTAPGVIHLWRIATDTPDYTADDLSGTGAGLTGGRWNARGTPLVYASVSCALACLETVVHLGGGMALPLNRYLVRIDIPAAQWAARAVFDASQHVGWDALPAGRVSIAWGTAWAGAGTSLLAQVPSVIVPEEHNLLINPQHPAASQVRAVKLRRWLYDPRAAGMAVHA
ncbi:MAG: RES family NAD+ phosphorylase [Pseudomonadota bacterium]|nr:RES family NAD+ phosphorylase [Pseudomonadota bacterium]